MEDYYYCSFACTPENTKKRKEMYIECGAEGMSYRKHKNCSEDCYQSKIKKLREDKE